MKIKDTKIPLLPLSAIFFYFVALLFFYFGIVPSAGEVTILLERLYANHWVLTLFIAIFFEGLVYVGLYFAGSSIATLMVLFSDGRIFTLVTMGLIIALTLTLVSAVNYALGRHIISRPLGESKEIKKERKLSRGFLLSCLHPNILAFYFFNLGLKRKSPWKIALVPLVIFPYEFLASLLIIAFKPLFMKGIESPYTVIAILVGWFVVAFILKNDFHKKLI